MADPPPAETEAGAVLSAEQLWEQAVADRDAERPMAAAILFQRLQQQYPEAEQAEEALWQAAEQAKKHALTAKEPYWKYVRDLYRRYAIDYPNSPRYQEAYFEEGVAYFNMSLFREALIYFNLFLKRFPESKLVPHVRYWQGQTFLRVGRFAEATTVFEELSKSSDFDLRVRGYVGLGDALYASGQYLAALAAYKRLLVKAPKFRLQDPSVLLKLGVTYFKVGNEAQGRKQLFHFLNLDKTSRQRAEAIFEIGESYYREGQAEAAQRLYEMAEEEGVGDERGVVLSRFRRAQYRDDPARVLPEWSKPVDLADPAGDQPYVAVLDHFYREPIAQEARLGLLARYRARKDEARLLQVATNFVQHAPDGPLRRQVEEEIGDILARRVEQYLANQQYQEVYDLYRNEYRHVQAYGKGRLRYLIGQAFEALTLYDQAAVIYYRALGLPLADADKVDLYYRRARVYLALKDWPAADRLLTHLRKIYQGDPAAGEIAYLSGLLAEEQGKAPEALGFYLQAVQTPSVAEHRPLYAVAALGSLLRVGRGGEAQPLLARFAKEGWLVADQLQEWYGRLGDGLQQAGDRAGAVAAYQAGLGEGLPQEGVAAQSLHLRMGKALADAGSVEQARKHFEVARSGPDKVLGQVAQERFAQLAIETTMATMGGAVLGQ